MATLSGKKNIIKTVSETEPSNPNNGDLWYYGGELKRRGDSAWAIISSGGVVGGPGSDYGYSLGGYDYGNGSLIDRITFPFDSGTASHVGNMSSTRYYVGGVDGTDFSVLFT